MRDLEGKTYFVTGGNTGLGKATVFALARRGGEVVLASRSHEKAAAVLAELRAELPEAQVSLASLDLASLRSVERCAKTFLDSGKKLDVLVNNAGLAGSTGATEDGFEITTGTNHIGPFYLTELLLPRLREAGAARVVNVASDSHLSAKGIDWSHVTQPLSSPRRVLALYSESKLMNVVHARELAKRLEGTGITTYSLHPGVVASDVWREVPWPVRSIMKLFMLTNEEGARTQVRCATDPALAGSSGKYYKSEREARVNRAAEVPGVGEELFARSSELIAGALAR